MIARALMTAPKLILLDEPALGLAPLIVATVYEILQSLRAQGLTLLVVEQSTNRALANADRLYVMRSGEIVLHGAQRAAEPRRGRGGLFRLRVSPDVSRRPA